MDINELIDKKESLAKLTMKLDSIVFNLIEDRVDIINKIEDITKNQIKPLKEDLGLIDSDIYKIMSKSGQEKIKTDNCTAYMKSHTKVSIIDKEKAYRWAMNNPEAIKSDFIKSSYIKSLVKEGVVPDSDLDGIDINDRFTKLEFRKH